MTKKQLRCVVDTNVATTANDANPGAPLTCVAESARALQRVMASGHVFVDDGGLIVAEYRGNLNPKGQPGPGDIYLKWILTHEWGEEKVTRVKITEKPNDVEDFEELPVPPAGIAYDRSDRKFLAVAAAHPERPVILQAFDSKWWGWRMALAKANIKVCFLCEREIAKKHKEKMRR
ncbi:MAG: hypothetical protein L6R48_21555 [Planctomycetes bacterium]|nr:hypothetical protein [Planctomycetota bacterium]